MKPYLDRSIRARVFPWFATAAVCIAIIGFSKTFFYPFFIGTFRAHPLVYVHGVFLFGWVIFFFVQTWFIQSKKLKIHKKIGWVGAIIVSGVVSSTIVVGALASRKIAASGNMIQASSELLIIFIEMFVFAALVASAIILRKRPETHKRLMLLALLASLGPAWFRFRHYFPPVDNPVFVYSLLLADSMIAFAALSDFVRYRRVHWVYVFVGTAMVGVHSIEVFAFETSWFRAIGQVLAKPFI